MYASSIVVSTTSQAFAVVFCFATLWFWFYVTMQLRKYRDLQETRRELLTARSNVPAHWMGFAVAHHMTRNYTMAIEILKSYERTLPADRKPDIESNNLKFYMTQLLEEAGDLSGALAVLDSDAVWFINKTDLSIRRADLLTKLGRFDEAAPLWREHLAINPENYAFHRGLQCCVLKSSTHAVGKGLSLPSDDTNLTPDQVDGLVALYAELSSLQPKCRAHKRIPLSFLHASAPAFRDALAAYMKCVCCPVAMPV
jgi:N-alpha-acetyltransferase 15/16, NatA auxiliary subunit